MAKKAAARKPIVLSAKDKRNFDKYVRDKHMLRAKVAKKAGPAMKKLMQLTLPDEQNLTTTIEGYTQLCGQRRAAYREHVKAMTHSAEVAELLSTVAMRYGPRVKIWHNVVSWPVAVMIARYGEAPEHWPPAIDTDDAVQLRRILAGQRPMFEGVTPLGHGDIYAAAAQMANANPSSLMLGIGDSEE